MIFVVQLTKKYLARATFFAQSPPFSKRIPMQRLLPYYSLLSIVFLIGCIQAFFVGVPKTIKSHPVINHFLLQPDQSALMVIKNDSIVLERNTDTALPLASISKIVIAIAYAESVAAGSLNPEQLIDISALDRFNIDDENYANWKDLGEEEGWLKDQKVPLKYIAQGTVRLSVSTNADFLINLIGIDTINQWLENHNLRQHGPIFPFNASAILSHNSHQLDQETFIEQMAQMTDEVYYQETLAIQQKLSADQGGSYKQSLPQKDVTNKKYLKVWSDHFTKATAQDYAYILKLLSKRQSDEGGIQTQLDFLFEDWTFQENPGIDQQLDHLAYKGGSTGYLLNTVLYTTDKQGNRSIVIALLNDLKPRKHQLMGRLISDFVFKLAMDEAFLADTKKALKGPH